MRRKGIKKALPLHKFFAIAYFYTYPTTKMSDIISSLNAVQGEAALNYEGPSLIIAGAGSGKTRTLTHRIAYMLERGVHPANVLALTFTNKAAREMRERISALVDAPAARSLWVGTFHSIFSRILRIEAPTLGFTGSFTIYDPADCKSVIKTIVRNMGLDSSIYKENTIYSRISYAKNNLITPQIYAKTPDLLSSDREYRIPRLHDIYSAYVQYCKTADAMDFDDLLLYTNLLFQHSPDTLAKYAERFRYILVDEYQDTNFAQYLIVKMLGKAHHNLCVVGDDAQSIYSFRGANIQNILNFKKDYPECRVFKLEQNYRSTQNIVNAANSLIARNSAQLHKTCFSQGSEGEKITILHNSTDHEEGFRIAADIEDRRYARRIEYSAFAILYRTNAQSRIFEDSLRRKNIPYRIYAGTSFYQRKEIKDLLAYLRLIVNRRDNEAFKRIVNYPKRGIGDTTLEQIEGIAAQRGQSMWETILSLTPDQCGIKGTAHKKVASFLIMIDNMGVEASRKNAYDLARDVAAGSGILDDLRSEKNAANLSREQNVEELLNSIKAFCETYEEEHGSEPQISQYLETVSLLTDADSAADTASSVTLMTVHSAKGLEFDYVYVAGMEEGLFPNESIMSGIQNLEEERRLFYVALTRAKTKATLSYAHSRMRWGKVAPCRPSRFIGELNPKYVDMPLPAARAPMQETSGDLDYVFGRAARPAAPSAPAAEMSAGARFKPLPSAAVPAGNSAGKICVGAAVHHERFGAGEVISIDHTGGDARAAIKFAAAGTKVLLLRFAKLEVVG